MPIDRLRQFPPLHFQSPHPASWAYAVSGNLLLYCIIWKINSFFSCRHSCRNWWWQLVISVQGVVVLAQNRSTSPHCTEERLKAAAWHHLHLCPAHRHLELILRQHLLRPAVHARLARHEFVKFSLHSELPLTFRRKRRCCVGPYSISLSRPQTWFPSSD